MMFTFIWMALLPCLVSSLDADDTEVAETSLSPGNQCSEDRLATDICFQCTSIPVFDVKSLVTCCSDAFMFQFCQICLNYKDSCETLRKEVDSSQQLWPQDDNTENPREDEVVEEVGKEQNPVNPQKYTDENKLLGKVFMKSPKLFGRIMTTKNNEIQHTQSTENEGMMQKKFGRIFVRAGDDGDVDKRLRKLYMKANKYFG